MGCVAFIIAVILVRHWLDVQQDARERRQRWDQELEALDSLVGMSDNGHRRVADRAS